VPISFFQKPAVIIFYYFLHDAQREEKKNLNKTAAGIWARAQLYLAGRYSSKAPTTTTHNGCAPLWQVRTSNC